MSGGYSQAPYKPRPRGLRPVDALDTFIPAPRYYLTAVPYLLYCLITAAGLIAIGAFATYLGAALTLFIWFLGPLILLSGLGALATGLLILSYGITSAVFAMRGKPLGVYLALAHLVVSLVLCLSFLEFAEHRARTDYSPPRTTTSIPQSRDLPGYVWISVLIHVPLIGLALWDMRKGIRYSRLEALGNRLTTNDLIEAGLIRSPAEPVVNANPSRPNAYGARRDEKS